MTQTSNPVKINKVHITPKKGYKLGTASATWKKIKSLNKPTNANTPDVLNGTNPPTVDANCDDELSSESDSDLLVDYTVNGEIIILYKRLKIMELWCVNPEGDCLNLIHQLRVEVESTIVDFKVLDIDRYAFICQDASGKYTMNIYSAVALETSIALPTILQSLTKFSIKASNDYIIIANEQGLLYIYNRDLTPANSLNKLINIKKESCNPILTKNGKANLINDNDIVLQASVHSKNSEPIFEIVDSWLVYSPTKLEYLHLKATNTNSKVVEFVDPFKPPQESTPSKPSMFTPVKLPQSGSLLNRVLSSFSSTAVDGLFKLSALTVKNYKKNQVPVDVSVSLNSISKGISNLLYNTASTTASSIQKHASYFKPNDNHLIKVIDLSNDKVLGVFKPPGGVNNLSLSPYDLQLVQTNLKGDTFYMWDLYKLPQEVSLIGKFNRGKTSAVVEDIFWFINCHQAPTVDTTGNQSIISGNNSGFGCITKATGSVHWYNTNYLSGNSDNFPNSYNKSKKINDFLDSWILSSIGAKKFIPLPRNSHKNSASEGNNNTINQLAILDDKNQLKLVSTLNGSYMYKYDLPRAPLNGEYVTGSFGGSGDESSVSNGSKNGTNVYGSNSNNNSKTSLEKNTKGKKKAKVVEEQATTKRDNPLSQAEIETCSPFLYFINNNNIEFAIYESPISDTYAKGFGNDIAIKIVKPFGQQPNYAQLVPNKSTGSLLKGLVLDSDTVEHIDVQV